VYHAARLRFVGICFFSVQLIAQQAKPTQGATAPSSSGAPPGLNYPLSTLQQFDKPPNDKDDVFLCYTLVPVISSSAPFSLQSVTKIDGAEYSDPPRGPDGRTVGTDGKPKKYPHKSRDAVECKVVDADHPLESRQRIVLAFDTHLIDLDPNRSRLQSLNINVTFTQGATISQRPQRPSLSAAVQGANLSAAPHIYYFVVTDRLAGDAIPQLSVSLLYDPPAPGQPWVPLTIYPPGSIVFGPKGHFWQTRLGGVSSASTDDGWTPMLTDNIADPDLSPAACKWSPYGPSPTSSQTPPLPWSMRTPYAVGSVVFAPSNGLFYMETAAQQDPNDATKTLKCTSGPTYPFPGAIAPFLEIGDGYITTEVQNTPVQWTYASDNCDINQMKPWVANTPYSAGAEICQLGTPTRLYKATAAGYSELNPPTFFNPSNFRGDVKAPEITKEPTGQVQWRYLQDSCDYTPSNQPNSVAVSAEWQPNYYYRRGADLICMSDGGVQSLYGAVQNGRSASKPPVFQNPRTKPGLPQWTDIGIYPPAAVTTASVTEIQTNAISIPLAQVHTLAYYNVDSGVFVSTIRIPSFAYTTPPTINNGTPVQTSSTLLVDPVITLTRYFWGFDYERREHASDWRPGLSLSFSMSSPTSNFYVGGSSEVIRYIQLNYGFAIAKVPRLSPGAFAPSSSTTPATFQVFAKGGYAGLTFNLSDFVKSLVKGGS
jgi:hypothetical protein